MMQRSKRRHHGVNMIVPLSLLLALYVSPIIVTSVSAWQQQTPITIQPLQSRRIPQQQRQQLLLLRGSSSSDDSESIKWKVSPPPPAKAPVEAASNGKPLPRPTTPISPAVLQPTGLQQPSATPSRTLRVERFARLPVWPVWLGVLVWAVSLVFGKEAGSQLETMTGGRVCPMQLTETNNSDSSSSDDDSSSSSSSPFLLLVHHHHRFPWWDVIGRAATKQFLPEGFPAHPHRGFTTLTYMLQGGFIHRDSMGVKQEYYGQSTTINKESTGKVTLPLQWLFTGAGLLHEEMFDTTSQQEVQELYQLWINVPSSEKMGTPETKLLSMGEDMPVITESHVSQQQDNEQCITTKSTIRVLAGKHRGKQSTAPIMSPMHILHATVKTSRNRRSERKVDGMDDTFPASFAVTSQPIGWTYEIPANNFKTVMIYVRQGNCQMTFQNTVVNSSKGTSTATSEPTRVPIHSTVFLEPSIQFQDGRVERETLTIIPETIGETVDVLVLAGEPLYEPSSTTTIEPVAMKGSMVMNYDFEIDEAYRDYQYGKMGRPWSEELSDEEWKKHVTKYPNQYYAERQKRNNKNAAMMGMTTGPNETVDYRYLDDDGSNQ